MVYTRFSGKCLGEWRKNEVKHPASDCLWANKMYLVVVKTIVLVRSSRSGVWGGALPGTVRSLPVEVENRKELVFPSARLQLEYDEDFLYGRLFYVVKLLGKK